MTTPAKLAEITALLKDLPILETERLLLRKLSMHDAEDMYEYAIDPEIASRGLWLPFHSLEDSLADLSETLEMYAKGELPSWAIVHKADNKMIGRCGLQRYSPTHFRAELSYAMNRHYWGQGYMTEAARRLVQFGFEVMELNRIEAVVLPENIGSIRVLQKVGMSFEGVRREHTFIRGKFDDLQMYSILRPEWAGPK